MNAGRTPTSSSVLPSLPQRIIANWANWWPQEDHAVMVADAQERLRAACATWQLTDLQPFPTGEVAAVFSARRDRTSYVLKINPRVRSQVEGFVLEATALRFWASTGTVVPVIDDRDDGLTLLMPRLRSGRTLHETEPDGRVVLSIVGATARKLRSAGLPMNPEIFERFDGSRRAENIRAVLPGTTEAAIFEELLASASADNDALLHGDLHARNIVADGPGWRLLDPKPCRAEPSMEMHGLLFGSHLRLPATDAPAYAHATVRWYADAAGLDPQRTFGWARVKTRANALWAAQFVGGSDWARELLLFADALAAHKP